MLAILAVVLGYAQYTGFDAARWIKDKMLSWKDEIQSMGLAGAARPAENREALRCQRLSWEQPRHHCCLALWNVFLAQGRW